MLNVLQSGPNQCEKMALSLNKKKEINKQFTGLIPDMLIGLNHACKPQVKSSSSYCVVLYNIFIVICKCIKRLKNVMKINSKKEYENVCI